MTRTELAAAYAATTYRLYLPDGIFDLRLEQQHSRLHDWLMGQGIREFVIITADNPGSLLLDLQENAVRLELLAAELQQAGYQCHPAANIPDGDWPAEQAFLVLAMPVNEALALAWQFGQLAVVYGTDEGVPRLLWG